MFVHLRLHTEFSIQDGTTRIDDALQMATQHGQPALAITDLGNLFGAIKFYKAAFSNGIQPIIGADIYLKDDTSQQSEISRLLLIAQKSQRNYYRIHSC